MRELSGQYRQCSVRPCKDNNKKDGGGGDVVEVQKKVKSKGVVIDFCVGGRGERAFIVRKFPGFARSSFSQEQYGNESVDEDVKISQ